MSLDNLQNIIVGLQHLLLGECSKPLGHQAAKVGSVTVHGIVNSQPFCHLCHYVRSLCVEGSSSTVTGGVPFTRRGVRLATCLAGSSPRGCSTRGVAPEVEAKVLVAEEVEAVLWSPASVFRV